MWAGLPAQQGMVHVGLNSEAIALIGKLAIRSASMATIWITVPRLRMIYYNPARGKMVPRLNPGTLLTVYQAGPRCC